MNDYELLLILSASCANTLAAFPHMAAKMGWRTGALFALPAHKITLAATSISVALVVTVAVNIFVLNVLSVWWIVGLPAAYLVGGMAVTAVLGRSAGSITFVVTPVLFLAYLVLSVMAARAGVS